MARVMRTAQVRAQQLAAFGANKELEPPRQFDYGLSLAQFADVALSTVYGEVLFLGLDLSQAHVAKSDDVNTPSGTVE